LAPHFTFSISGKFPRLVEEWPFRSEEAEHPDPLAAPDRSDGLFSAGWQAPANKIVTRMTSGRLNGFLIDSPFSHEEVELHDDAFTESMSPATLHQRWAGLHLADSACQLVRNRRLTHRVSD
jgi:hypothetical protein